MEGEVIMGAGLADDDGEVGSVTLMFFLLLDFFFRETEFGAVF